MKKTAVIFTVVTAALGAVGAALHRIEIDTSLDPISGLAARSAPITICMAVVAVLAAIIVFALTFLVKGRNVAAEYHIAFAPKTPVPLATAIVSGAGMIAGAYICFVYGVGIRSSEKLVLVLSLFAALAGISVIVMNLMAMLKKSGAETMLCSFVEVLFLCLWLIVYYLEKSADPAMISYVYDYLAVCAAAVAGYYTAGYAYGRSRPRTTLFFSMLAAFFCMTAMPAAHTLSFSLFFAAVALQQLVNIFLLANNLQDTSAAVEAEPAQEKLENGENTEE